MGGGTAVTMISRKVLQAGQRIRVLVVDDSVVMRRLVTHALESDALIEVVGAAANGAIALARIPQLNPDVVTLDIEMPEMDGLEALLQMRQRYPDLRVVMLSTLTEKGAAITLDALERGADDYVTKASSQSSLEQSLQRLRADLLPRIRQFFMLPATHLAAAQSPQAVSASPWLKQAGQCAPGVVGIGVSTGGPSALAQILPLLPADFPLPILLVQHMPPLFTRLLAERLQNLCALEVHEARDGELIQPGKILVAPGDVHMKAARGSSGFCVRLDQGAPLNSCRPSVDALFSSLAEIYGGAVLAVILTGMGQDGLRGAEMLKARGARLLAQDEASSVVWGMPGAVAAAGLADQVLPLEQISPVLLHHASKAGSRLSGALWPR